MVELAEYTANEAIKRKELELDKLVEDYTETLKLIETSNDPEEREVNIKLSEGMKHRLDNFSYASVLWSTQYKSGFTQSVDVPVNEELWYEFKARSEQNCENYNVATTLGQLNHDVGAYCAVACPFRDKCKLHGYLAQEKERREKPITVVRHQHLHNANMINEYGDLVLIDESPLNIIDTPLVFSSVDFRPHVMGWEMEVADSEMVHCINLLEQALRIAIKSNADEPQQMEDDSINKAYMVSGSNFLQLLDKNLSLIDKNYPLVKVVKKIDLKVLEDIYQPSFINGNIASIQKRAMPFLFKEILSEIDNYEKNPDNQFPSGIHLVSGRLEVYSSDSFRLSSSTPIVVADATAEMPELYQAGFNREVDIYAPKVRNPNAKIIVASGSDWTRGELERKLGKQLKDRSSRKTEYVEDVTGDKFYLHDIPTNPTLYEDNKLLKDYEDVIYSVVEKHNSVLVVVHKKVREILEDVFNFKYPAASRKISWGHYGALRGTNQYKACDAVVLLGVPRVPYDVVWRKIQAWAKLLRIESPIPYVFVYRPKPYQGQNMGHSYRTFDNPFAQRFVDMVEEGECIQSMERIRPHATDENKYIYICASRPIDSYITQVTTKTNLLNLFRNDSSLNRTKSYMLQFYKDIGKLPSKRETMSSIKVGYETYVQAREIVETILTKPGYSGTIGR